MSAFLAVRKSASVEVLADCGSWDVSGKLVGRLSKIIPVGRTRGVIVSRGDIRLTWVFVRFAAALFDTFDDLVLGYRGAMAQVRQALPPDLARFGMHHLVAGYSAARRRVETYLDDDSGDLHETMPLMGGGPESGLLRFLAPYITPSGDWLADRIEALDLVAEGIPAFEAMRRQPCPLFEGGPQVVGVGFGLEYVRLGARGVETRKLVHTWPGDRPGERIAA